MALSLQTCGREFLKGSLTTESGPSPVAPFSTTPERLGAKGGSVVRGYADVVLAPVRAWSSAFWGLNERMPYLVNIGGPTIARVMDEIGPRFDLPPSRAPPGNGHQT